MAPILALGLVLLARPPAEAFEKWRTKEILEISGADGVPFEQPSDLAVFEGKIYVLDALNNRLCWFDMQGKNLGAIRGSPEAPLVGAMGLAPDYRGRFFFADSYRGRILSLSVTGKLSIFATIIKENRETAPDPVSILYYDDRWYVVDNDNHRVRMYGTDGKSLGAWGGLGEGFGQFKYPGRIAVDPRGRIGITDVLNCRVQFFTPKGEFLSSFGGPGVVSGTFFRPGGFDIDTDGRVYVADNYFGVVQVFDVSGKLLAVLHDGNGNIMALKNPVALKIYRGNLYVLEMGASRVTAFSLIR